MSDKKMIILCGPSGSGKTTLAKHLLSEVPELMFSISATTRKPRELEQNAVDYYFLGVEEFQHKIEAAEFVEYEQVYEGLYYGTLKSEMERIWSLGKFPVLDIDVVGALNIKEKYAPHALTVFVHPVNMENIKQRLTKRATEDEESFNKRIGKAEKELNFAPKFDKIIYNDNLEKAIDIAEQYLYQYLLKDKKLSS